MRPAAKAIYVLFFTLLLGSLFLGMRVAKAQVPPPIIPCDDTDSPEFNSLRPYQASPCGDSTKSLYCGNSIIIYEQRTKITQDCELQDYPLNERVDKTYEISMEDLELPILGNTQLTVNSGNSSDQIDDAQKMNEYVSWYLNGVIERAEYPLLSYNDEGDIRKIIDFSGPIKKLLSSDSLTAQRIDTIEATTERVLYQDEDTESPVSEIERHDQVVACTLNVAGIDFGIPVPCYKFDLDILGLHLTPITKEHRLKEWMENDKYPPLREDFDNFADYYQEYRKWRGDRCLGFFTPLLNKELFLCFDDPTRPNYYSTLFPYVPLSSTEDKKSKQPIGNVHLQEMGGTVVEYEQPNNKYEILDEVALNFPHTQEDLELSQLLNSSYLPKDSEEQQINYDTVETEEDEFGQCRVINVRSNPGDNLFAEYPPNTYEVKVSPYVIETIPCKTSCTCETKIERDPISKYVIGSYEVCSKTCSGGVAITINTNVKIPNAKQIFTDTTAGDASTFRRIFPKVEEGAPVDCIANIPTVTTAQYSAVSGTDEITVQEPDRNKTDGTDAKVYFPYIGSIYEYFLKGIQTALRPQGYGEPLANGQFCRGPECGELPDSLPKASGSCSLGGISSSVGDIPQSLKDIVEAAAQTYNTPPNLILGIMYGEGLFNPGRFDWTDENVKNWATCEPVPGCNESGDDNFMGFNGNDFANIISQSSVADDLEALDPNRLPPSQCNLLDAIYAMSWNLHNSADGGGSLPLSCFGIPLFGDVPSSCSWNRENYASAIKVAESGYTDMCFTEPGSCVGGGGEAAACSTGGDTCETVGNRDYKNTSHFGCIWDVAHGQ